MLLAVVHKKRIKTGNLSEKYLSIALASAFGASAENMT